MDDFFEKWKKDKKYRTKVKLLAYTTFVVIISIYALSINGKTPPSDISDDNYQSSSKTDIINTDSINIPTNYKYTITVNINDEIYTYKGEKTTKEEIIEKENSGIATNYRYFDNEYYVLTDDLYTLTTKSEVYDNVNYNYINLTNINKYLEKAQKNNNEYHVYLNNVILNSNSDDYFIIKLEGDSIDIDYTSLVRITNPNIYKYQVNITIEEK